MICHPNIPFDVLPYTTHRYETMQLCWCMDPQERPKFQSLVMSLSRQLERESGYLDLSSSLCWKDTSDLPQSNESHLPVFDEEGL